MMDMAKKAGLMETDSLVPNMDDIVQDGQPGYYNAMLQGEQFASLWLGYTESLGDPGLRQAIASLYDRIGQTK
jgi:hypothetical protein